MSASSVIAPEAFYYTQYYNVAIPGPCFSHILIMMSDKDLGSFIQTWVSS